MRLVAAWMCAYKWKCAQMCICLCAWAHACVCEYLCICIFYFLFSHHLFLSIQRSRYMRACRLLSPSSSGAGGTCYSAARRHICINMTTQSRTVGHCLAVFTQMTRFCCRYKSFCLRHGALARGRSKVLAKRKNRKYAHAQMWKGISFSVSAGQASTGVRFFHHLLHVCLG